MQKIKVNVVQNVSRDCVVCGTRNPFSLRAKFFECENEILVGIFEPRDEHQSYPGRMHGGMVSSIIDETIGRAVQIGNPDAWGVTGELKIRYTKPTPIGETLKCFAKLTCNTSRLFKGVAILETQSGELVASGEATYVKMDISKIAEGFSDEDWFRDDTKLPVDVILHNDKELASLCEKLKK